MEENEFDLNEAQEDKLLKIINYINLTGCSMTSLKKYILMSVLKVRTTHDSLYRHNDDTVNIRAFTNGELATDMSANVVAKTVWSYNGYGYETPVRLSTIVLDDKPITYTIGWNKKDEHWKTSRKIHDDKGVLIAEYFKGYVVIRLPYSDSTNDERIKILEYIFEQIKDDFDYDKDYKMIYDNIDKITDMESLLGSNLFKRCMYLKLETNIRDTEELIDYNQSEADDYRRTLERCQKDLERFLERKEELENVIEYNREQMERIDTTDYRSIFKNELERAKKLPFITDIRLDGNDIVAHTTNVVLEGFDLGGYIIVIHANPIFNQTIRIGNKKIMKGVSDELVEGTIAHHPHIIGKNADDMCVSGRLKQVENCLKQLRISDALVGAWDILHNYNQTDPYIKLNMFVMGLRKIDKGKTFSFSNVYSLSDENDRVLCDGCRKMVHIDDYDSDMDLCKDCLIEGETEYYCNYCGDSVSRADFCLECNRCMDCCSCG